jgi:hypothetical protein
VKGFVQGDYELIKKKVYALLPKQRRPVEKLCRFKSNFSKFLKGIRKGLPYTWRSNGALLNSWNLRMNLIYTAVSGRSVQHVGGLHKDTIFILWTVWKDRSLRAHGAWSSCRRISSNVLQ